MLLKDLEKLLKKDIANLSFKTSCLEESVWSYKKAIERLEKGDITKNAKRLLYDRHRLVITPYNIKEMLEVLKNDLFIAETNLNMIKSNLELSKTIYNALVYHQIISPSLMNFLKNRLLEENIDDISLIKTMEYIKIHNTQSHSEKSNSISSKDLYLILNMLNQGYEEIIIEQCENVEKLEEIIANSINIIENNPLSIVYNNLILDKLSYTEKEYVYKRILKYYQNKIFDLISILKNKEFYFSIAILQSIKDEYKELYQKYMYIRTQLDSLIETKNVEIDYSSEEKGKEAQTISGGGVSLYYSSNSKEPEKCYFVRDLINIREEAYETILDLIETFKQGNNVNTKYLSTNSNFIELKKDQIRIVLKPLGNNNYSVMGAFIKKSTNDIHSYQTIFNRPIAEINDEYSYQVEEYYKSFLEENKRKGSR